MCHLGAVVRDSDKRGTETPAPVRVDMLTTVLKGRMQESGQTCALKLENWLNKNLQ